MDFTQIPLKRLDEFIKSNGKGLPPELATLFVSRPAKFPSLKITDSEDDVTGFGGSVEISQFSSSASQEQFAFYKYLVEKDEAKSIEYAFGIVGATEHWARDLRILQVICDALKVEEKHLSHELHSLSKGLRDSSRPHVERVLAAYLPHLLKDIKLSDSDMKSNLLSIREAYKKVHGEEDVISHRIHQIESNFPFLKEAI